MGKRAKAFFFVMPEIFHQTLWRQGGQVVRTPFVESEEED